jgi:hypothetical protein
MEGKHHFGDLVVDGRIIKPMLVVKENLVDIKLAEKEEY